MPCQWGRWLERSKEVAQYNCKPERRHLDRPCAGWSHRAMRGFPEASSFTRSWRKGRIWPLFSPYAEDIPVPGLLKSNHLLFHNPLTVPERECCTVPKALQTGMLSPQLLLWSVNSKSPKIIVQPLDCFVLPSYLPMAWAGHVAYEQDRSFTCLGSSHAGEETTFKCAFPFYASGYIMHRSTPETTSFINGFHNFPT